MSHGRKTKCMKGCCWNPYGVCAKRGLCACHTGNAEGKEDLAAVIALEQARLERVRPRRRESTWSRH